MHGRISGHCGFPRLAQHVPDFLAGEHGQEVTDSSARTEASKRTFSVDVFHLFDGPTSFFGEPLDDGKILGL